MLSNVSHVFYEFYDTPLRVKIQTNKMKRKDFQ